MLKLPPELEQWGIFPKFHISRLAPHEPNDMSIFPGHVAQVFYNFGENPEKELQVHKLMSHIWDLNGIYGSGLSGLWVTLLGNMPPM